VLKSTVGNVCADLPCAEVTIRDVRLALSDRSLPNRLKKTINAKNRLRASIAAATDANTIKCNKRVFTDGLLSQQRLVSEPCTANRVSLR